MGFQSNRIRILAELLLASCRFFGVDSSCRRTAHVGKPHVSPMKSLIHLSPPRPHLSWTLKFASLCLMLPMTAVESWAAAPSAKNHSIQNEYVRLEFVNEVGGYAQ